MQLKNFEENIEQKIVERGLSYYKGGDVKRLEKVGADEYSAVVFGTERYSVFVKLKDDAIIGMERPRSLS